MQAEASEAGVKKGPSAEKDQDKDKEKPVARRPAAVDRRVLSFAAEEGEE